MIRAEELAIGEVARRTGLSERTLRHYEAEGLLKPLRSSSGRRCYRTIDLERLSEILLLKRAGFTVAQIRSIAGGKGDFSRLVAAQLEVLKLQEGEMRRAVALLSSVKARLDRCEAIDAGTLCNVIREGEKVMADDQWKKVADRYYSPEEQAVWKAKKEELAKAGGFDQASYSRAWEDLSARIDAALPLDPESARPRAFHDEWNRLLEPFMKIATPEMTRGASRVWANMNEWQGEMKSPISPRVWSFMTEVSKLRKT